MVSIRSLPYPYTERDYLYNGVLSSLAHLFEVMPARRSWQSMRPKD